MLLPLCPPASCAQCTACVCLLRGCCCSFHCRFRFRWRSKVLGAIGKEVKEFYGGSHSQAALTQTTGVIVCTIEKANIMWVGPLSVAIDGRRPAGAPAQPATLNALGPWLMLQGQEGTRLAACASARHV